jgi:site-specific DNA recombinase
MARRARRGDPGIAVGIVRVSTEDQALSPASQCEKLEAWARRKGVRLVAVFLDLGVSGAANVEARPGLLAALDAVRAHRAGTLVAASRCRIARDVVVAGLVDRAVASAGAVLRTADGTSDADGAHGALLKGVLDLYAGFERMEIKRRTTQALAVKRSRGEKLGGHTPYGYALSEDGVHLVMDAHEQSVIALVTELHARGRSHRSIVGQLAERGVVGRTGRPLRQTQVARMLHRPANQLDSRLSKPAAS